MIWKEFLTPVLAAHGKKVPTPPGAPQTGGETWVLQGGTLFTLVVGPQSLEFRADGGYLVQVLEEYLLVSREKPLHEATYVFYPHISAFRLQKADLASEESGESQTLRRPWD